VEVDFEMEKTYVWFGEKIDESEMAKESLFTQKSAFVADAYTVKDREEFLEDLIKAGAIPTTTQSLIFELLGDSSKKEFKACLEVIKAAPEWVE